MPLTAMKRRCGILISPLMEIPLILQRDLFHIHAGNLNISLSVQEKHQFINLFLRPLHFHLHTAVRKILHPAGQPQLSGLVYGK